MTTNKVLTVETSNDVCPDLVPSSDFGYHRSFVLSNRRYWVFERPEKVDAFIAAVERGDFRRTSTERK